MLKYFARARAVCMCQNCAICFVNKSDTVIAVNSRTEYLLRDAKADDFTQGRVQNILLLDVHESLQNLTAPLIAKHDVAESVVVWGKLFQIHALNNP